MLQAVDQHCQHLSFMDPICDFLYHIKYMYTGDSVKEQVRFRENGEFKKSPLRRNLSSSSYIVFVFFVFLSPRWKKSS